MTLWELNLSFINLSEFVEVVLRWIFWNNTELQGRFKHPLSDLGVLFYLFFADFTSRALYCIIPRSTYFLYSPVKMLRNPFHVLCFFLNNRLALWSFLKTFFLEDLT